MLLSPCLLRTSLKLEACVVNAVKHTGYWNSVRYEHGKSDGKEGVFKKLMNIGSSDKSGAYSKLLTRETQTTYELQYEYVKPEAMQKYLDIVPEIQRKLKGSGKFSADLIGSWSSVYGDEDLVVHLWINRKGISGAHQDKIVLRTDPEIKDLEKQKLTCLRNRDYQLLNEFAFWEEPKPRTNISHVYELRSYLLKPGSLIDWTNNWGKAIDVRKEQAFGGFFSNIGPLYQVHYFWVYEDLVHRKEARENMWQQPEWGDCVANTVPLVQSMTSQLLLPLDSSPTK